MSIVLDVTGITDSDCKQVWIVSKVMFSDQNSPDDRVQYWAAIQEHMVALKVPPCSQEVY